MSERQVAATNWKHRTMTLGLVLMGITTLGSSWCGFQSSLWDGVQTFHLMDSADFSRQAAEKASLATEQRTLDYAADGRDNIHHRHCGSNAPSYREAWLKRAAPYFFRDQQLVCGY